MTPQLQEALSRELSELGATPIDPDVLEALDIDADADDVSAVKSAAEAVLSEHPNLFNVERKWHEVNPDSEEWRERERAFREGLRRSTPLGNNIFKDLDAALLTQVEETALKRYLGNRSDSYDRSILQNALAKQRKHLGGDAT